jgi:hypothetical protein
LPADARPTGIHDNCINFNRRYPHRVGTRHPPGWHKIHFLRDNRIYWRAERHNPDLDRDNDRMACEQASVFCVGHSIANGRARSRHGQRAPRCVAPRLRPGIALAGRARPHFWGGEVDCCISAWTPPAGFCNVLNAAEHFRQAALLDGTTPDPRMADAIELIRGDRRPDGTWLQARHPGRLWFEVDAPAGQPSKWLTLYGTRVLAWWDSSTPRS